jgi:hypothetical protein
VLEPRRTIERLLLEIERLIIGRALSWLVGHSSYSLREIGL